jgi:hypothetical protein
LACTTKRVAASHPTGGTLLGTEAENGVQVSNGYFSVELDFGANAFTGDARWLEIAVNCGSGSTTLSPRQALTPAPYALYATPYRRTVIVSPVGTAMENGTALLNALAGITDASATNPYLLKIEPGVYDLGTAQLTMKPYVDIEGSGEMVTTITSAGTGSDSVGTVRGANYAELRFLTVEATGGSVDTVAIYNYGASPQITHVTARASGATDDNFGVRNRSYSSPKMAHMTIEASGGDTSYGVFNLDSSSPEMTDLTITASGGTSNFGLFITRSFPTLSNVTITASGGTTSRGIHTYANGGAYTVRVNHSRITGGSNSILASNYFTILVGNSQLGGGPIDDDWGTITCAGVYDENYAFYASSCP